MREIVETDIACVRPYAGVCEYVLIIIADGRECFLTQGASGDIRGAVLEALVTVEFARTIVLLAAFVALEAFLVQHQMFVQSTSMMEPLAAQMTLVPGLSIPLLMPPLVSLHVPDFLAAKAADLQLRRVSSLYMMRQIDLQLITVAAMLANKFRVVIAVNANVVSLQPICTFVLYMANPALEEIIWSMSSLVLLQCS